MLTQAQQVELTKSLKSVLDSAFKHAGDGLVAQLKQNTANDNEPPSARRPSKWSASGGMEANRRLTSSVKNMNKQVGLAADIFGNLNNTAKGYHSQLERTMRLYGQVQDQMSITFRAQRKLRDVMGNEINNKKKLADLDEIRMKHESTYNKHVEEMTKAARKFVDDVNSYRPPAGPSAPGGPNRPNSNNQPGGEEHMGFLGKAVQGVTSKLMSMASVTTGTAMVLKDLQYALSTSSMVTTNTLTDSLQMGLTARQLLEMQAEFRADAMRSSGGVKEWTNQLKRSQMDLVAFTGSLAEANKVNAQLRSNYLALGFSLDEITNLLGKASGGIISDITKISAITGQTVSEVSKVMASITNSDENREHLLKMTKDQRLSYVTGQSKLLRQYIVLTGSVERAKAMMDQQNRNGNKTTIDRFKEGVRLKAAGGMLGMDPAVMDRFTELSQTAPGLLTDADKTEMAKIRGDLSSRVKSLQGSGSMSERLFADQLSAKLDLGGLDVFNTDLDKSMSPVAIAEQQASNFAAVVEGSPIAKKTVAVLSSIESILSQSITPIVAAMLVALGSKLSSKTILGGTLADMADIPSRDGKKTTGAKGKKAFRNARFGRELMMDAFSMDNARFGKVARVGAKVGAPLAIATELASLAVDHNWNPTTSDESRNKERTMDAMDTASAALMGATIGSFIAPGVGTAIGAALGGVVGAAYALSNDDYFKTVNELNASQQADQQAKHTMEMKMVQAEWEYRKNNFNAFQQEAGPVFHSNMQSLLDKHNAGLDEQQKVSLGSFSKFEDLRSALSTSLNDEELSRMEQLYNDETRNMAVRHNAQMDNMKDIHTLNLQQSDAYKELMKIENTMSALADFDTNGIFSADDIDAEDLKTALGQTSVTDSAAVLRDIAKNSGALDAAEFASLMESKVLPQMALGLERDGSFDFDDVKDDTARAALEKLFESMKADGKGNTYFKESLTNKLNAQQAVIDGIDTQIDDKRNETLQPQSFMQDTKAEDVRSYLQSKNYTPAELSNMGVSGVEDIMSRLESGNKINSPELIAELQSFKQTKQQSPTPEPDTTETNVDSIGVTGVDTTPNIATPESDKTKMDADDAVGHVINVSENRTVVVDDPKVQVEPVTTNILPPAPEPKARPKTSVATSTSKPTIAPTSVDQALNDAMKDNMKQVSVDTKISKVDMPTFTSSLEKTEPAGSKLDSKAATLGTTDVINTAKRKEEGKGSKAPNSADTPEEGKVGFADVVAELRESRTVSLRMIDLLVQQHTNASTEEERRHIEAMMMGGKPMQPMRGAKSGS